jgi:hypothetical protein
MRQHTRPWRQRGVVGRRNAAPALPFVSLTGPVGPLLALTGRVSDYSRAKELGLLPGELLVGEQSRVLQLVGYRHGYGGGRSIGGWRSRGSRGSGRTGRWRGGGVCLAKLARIARIRQSGPALSLVVLFRSSRRAPFGVPLADLTAKAIRAASVLAGLPSRANGSVWERRGAVERQRAPVMSISLNEVISRGTSSRTPVSHQVASEAVSVIADTPAQCLPALRSPLI